VTIVPSADSAIARQVPQNTSVMVLDLPRLSPHFTWTGPGFSIVIPILSLVLVRASIENRRVPHIQVNRTPLPIQHAMG
jgi:hypothetical protein